MSARRSWLGWAAPVASGLALLSATDGGGFRRYLVLRQQISSLQQKNRQLSEQNAELLREVEAMRNDPKAQERAAREELGFIKPGEVVIQLE